MPILGLLGHMNNKKHIHQRFWSWPDGNWW